MVKTKKIDISLKPIIVFLSFLIALGIFVFSTLFATSVCTKWYGLLIGVALMLVAIPIHCQGEKFRTCYALSFLVNSVANGFSLSAYYIDSENSLNVTEMLKASVLPVALLFVVFLLIKLFPEIKKYICISGVVIGCIMLVAFIVLSVKQGGVIFSFGFFATLLSLFYYCIMGVTANNNRDGLRDISFGSFAAFIIISIVVLFIISDGEILEAFDISGGESSQKSKKNK